VQARKKKRERRQERRRRIFIGVDLELSSNETILKFVGGQESVLKNVTTRSSAIWKCCRTRGTPGRFVIGRGKKKD